MDIPSNNNVEHVDHTHFNGGLGTTQMVLGYDTVTNEYKLYISPCVPAHDERESVIATMQYGARTFDLNLMKAVFPNSVSW